MSGQKKSWSELSVAERAGMVLAGLVQIGLLAAAQADLWRRPPEQIRGRRWAWALVCLINFVGPIAYFIFGRLPAEQAPVEHKA